MATRYIKLVVVHPAIAVGMILTIDRKGYVVVEKLDHVKAVLYGVAVRILRDRPEIRLSNLTKYVEWNVLTGRAGYLPHHQH